MSRRSRTLQRRVKRFQRDALEIAIDAINEDVLAPSAIAARSMVLIEEAARVSNRTYTGSEAADVIARFWQAWNELTAVGGRA